MAKPAARIHQGTCRGDAVRGTPANPALYTMPAAFTRAAQRRSTLAVWARRAIARRRRRIRLRGDRSRLCMVDAFVPSFCRLAAALPEVLVWDVDERPALGTPAARL